ncbi:MAG: purine-binding chemotaxis protein CheW [Spirochaetes bacterium]|nr:purine-binding chemotaxis protein CheW [Spirochaetota bacterium]
MNSTAIHESRGGKQEGVVKDQKQFVTFVISNENYGVPVLKVQEIIGMTEIVHVPNCPDFMKGVINLRGSVVPVIDMRKRFNMEERQYDMFTVIIIVEVRDMLVGMIVDSVSDVVDMPAADIQKTPNFTVKIDTDFINGIGQIGEKLVIILDIEKILSVEEIESLESEETATA